MSLNAVLPKLIRSNQKIVMKLAKTESSVGRPFRSALGGIPPGISRSQNRNGVHLAAGINN